MILTSHLYQPLDVYFVLDIGELRKEIEPPEIPIDFSIEFDASDTKGNFSITLFDDVAHIVENAIIENQEPEWGSRFAILQWGYRNVPNGESPPYKVMLDAYSLSMGRNYFTITLKGTTSTNLSAIVSHKIEGTLMECIEQYCQFHKLVHNISPPFDSLAMKELNKTGNTTEFTHGVYTRVENESDYAFLRRIIEKHARGVGGIGGYVMYEDPSTQTLHITTKESKFQEFYGTYKVQDKDSVVIEWSPNLDLNISLLEKAQIVQKGNQEGSGDPITTAANPIITKVIPIEDSGINKVTLTDDKMYKKFMAFGYDQENLTRERTFNRSVMGSTGESRVAFNETANRFQRLNALAYEASMTVEGDPHLFPGKVCEVIYEYPSSYNPKYEDISGQVHYSSGRYYIKHVTHNISSSGYTCALQLQRQGEEEKKK
jgi:hypothetical protein